MEKSPAYDLLHRIAYSLSYGEMPAVTLPSRVKNNDQYQLLKSSSGHSLYAEDLFQGEHLKLPYRDYLLKTLSPALRVANRGDFGPKSVLVQGPAEYFVLSCPNGQQRLFYMGPYPHLISWVRTQEEIDRASKREMTSFTPSNISAAELIRLRQTRRPYGDLYC